MQPSNYLPDPKTGLHLPASDRPNLRVGIENWINVQRIENGSGKASGSWRFPNLMLNRGLDEHFKSDLLNLGDYGAASEDGTAPVVTDTSLLSEVLRSNASGGISQQITEVAAGHIKVVDTRQLASDGNYNIRKVGFSENSTPAGPVNVAEQIKDAGGNPDVVTLDATQSLRMGWEHHYYFAPIAATAGNVQVSGFPGQNPDPASRTGVYSFTRYSGYTIYTFLNALSGYLRVSGIDAAVTAGVAPIAWGTSSSLPNAPFGISAVKSYADGEYYREAKLPLDANQASHEIRGVLIRDGVVSPLYTWNFDAGQAPTKDNLGKATIKLPRISLARRP